LGAASPQIGQGLPKRCVAWWAWDRAVPVIGYSCSRRGTMAASFLGAVLQ
jgi:hypothetical protein